ncbi:MULTISPECIES: DUF6443 domain-containing protein [Chitinophagaceae]
MKQGYNNIRHLPKGQTHLAGTLAVFLTVFCLAGARAQSSANNYVAAWSANAPDTGAVRVTTRPAKDVSLEVRYFDGLGRPLQTVVRQGSLPTTGTGAGTAVDLVTPIEYDAFGRQAKSYLPYAASTADASYKTGAAAAQNGFYTGGTSPVADGGGGYPYSQTDFELSPLDRPLKVSAPGSSWVGSSRGVSTGYWANTATDAVRIWNVSATTNGTFSTYSSPGVYQPGQLYKTITTDEAGKQVVEFKDKEGRVVLKKVQLTAAADNGSGSGYTGWLCTYYVYDDLGNLRLVVQPEGVSGASSGSLTAAQLSEQCFRYEYDARNRMVVKKVPGAGEVYTVYDVRDLPVMVQDANLRASNSWVVTRYDNLNRPVKAYYTSNSTAFASLLAAAYGVSPYIPSGDSTNVLTVTHYDDYAGLPSGLSSTMLTAWNTYFTATSTSTWPYPVMPSAVGPSSTPVTTRGLVTWTQAKVLGTASTMLSTVNLYDDHGRVVQTQSQNLSGGVDVTTTQYAWNGRPLLVARKTQKAGSRADTTVVLERYTYDNLWRVSRVEEKIVYSRVNKGAASDWLVMADNAYDALGQLRQKSVGRKRSGTTETRTTTPIEVQDYDYNVRGWLLGVNRAYAREASTTNTTAPAAGEMHADPSSMLYDPSSRLWGFDLGYDRTANNLINGKIYTAAQYTGNISGMVWKTGSRGRVRKYDFSYDAANRLTAANFTQYAGSAFATTAGDFSVSGLAYDNNGNIKTMVQNGVLASGASAVVDNLAYSYQAGSNKLARVADAVKNNATEKLGDFQDGANTDDDYAYDGNGNLIKDQNKGITSITYNYLNLPQVVAVAGKGTITYTYDATGNRWQKATYDQATGKTTTTLYLGANQYRNDTLQFFGTSEGRIRAKDSTGLVVDYFLKDHLGNTRLVVTDQAGVYSPVLEETHYYPFGLTMKGISSSQSNPMLANKKKYNGIEFDDDLDLNTYEAFYRDLDPQTGRWWQQDPEIDNMEAWSPYASNFDNPVSQKDPLGNEPEDGPGRPGGILDLARAGLKYLENKFSGNRTVQRYVGAMEEGLGNLDMVANPVGTVSGMVSSTYNDAKSSYVSARNGDAGGMSEGLANAFLPGYKAGKAEVSLIKSAINGDAKAQGALGMQAILAVSGGLEADGAKAVGNSVKTVSPITEDAAALSQKIEKNSITLGTPTKQIRYDLVGKEHGGVPTPHKQIYNKNFVNGVQKSISRASKEAVPMTQQDIRMLRKYIEKNSK